MRLKANIFLSWQFSTLLCYAYLCIFSNYLILDFRDILLLLAVFIPKMTRCVFNFFLLPLYARKDLWHSLLALESSSAKMELSLCFQQLEKKESSLERNFKVQVCTIQFSTWVDQLFCFSEWRGKKMEGRLFCHFCSLRAHCGENIKFCVVCRFRNCGKVERVSEGICSYSLRCKGELGRHFSPHQLYTRRRVTRLAFHRTDIRWASENMTLFILKLKALISFACLAYSKRE